ncbi:ferredoxin-type protein NapG [Zoogloea sp.]|uniref:ferredoxin-type protein NapG n=1 Tax=Zoogloea sp. TaxID=49181 RepID=UPI00260BA30C|nr:ferredoxin-type protein NapG [Zoogloea sp.]MDD3353578.1 ferredoxin-type protein NapG [Zoogloea sp.]
MDTGQKKNAPRSSVANSPASVARRKFINSVAAAAGGGCLLALGASLYSRSASALPAQALRPPGALPEADFLAACVRCGLCVRDCPYDTLKLSDLGAPVPTGTPYFHARSVPCEMCEDIPCVKACPTGALDPALTDINQARMGLAALIDHETCLNFLGLRCDVCYRVCPVIDKAITLETQHNPRSDRHAMLLPTVHSDACTGCGKCEKSCVLPEPAIKVFPRPLAQGALPEHYRKGWEEKARHGGSLIGDQVEMPIRGFEGSTAGRSATEAAVAPVTPAPDLPATPAVPVAPAPKGPSGLNSHWKP